MRWQIYGVGMATIISALGLGLIIWKTDPAVAPSFLKASFFVALFIFIWGGSTLIIFSIKNRLPKPRPLDESTHESILSASLLGGLVISLIVIVVILSNKFLK